MHDFVTVWLSKAGEWLLTREESVSLWLYSCFFNFYQAPPTDTHGPKWWTLATSQSQLKFEEHPIIFSDFRARSRVEFSLNAPCLGGFVILGPQALGWFQEFPPFTKPRISIGTSKNGLLPDEDGIGKGAMAREDETVGSRIPISFAHNCPHIRLITLQTS